MSAQSRNLEATENYIAQSGNLEATENYIR